jgi:hypothetical protein
MLGYPPAQWSLEILSHFNKLRAVPYPENCDVSGSKKLQDETLGFVL